MALRPTLTIGDKIRTFRLEKNLSIQKLAEMAGVSPAGIYKVERNEMIPTVTFLMKVAGALDKRVASFLDEEDKVYDVAYISRKGRKKIGPIGTKIQGEKLSSRLPGSKLEAGILEIGPGHGSGRDTLSHGGEELHLCLGGRIEFRIGGKKYLLGEGDCIHFKSDIPHSWRNTGRKKVKMLYVTRGDNIRQF